MKCSVNGKLENEDILHVILFSAYNCYYGTELGV